MSNRNIPRKKRNNFLLFLSSIVIFLSLFNVFFIRSPQNQTKKVTKTPIPTQGIKASPTESPNEKCKKIVNSKVDEMLPYKNETWSFYSSEILYSPDCSYKLIHVGTNDSYYVEGGYNNKTPPQKEQEKYMGLWLFNVQRKEFKKISVTNFFALGPLFENWIDNERFVFHGYDKDDFYKKFIYNVVSGKITPFVNN